MSVFRAWAGNSARGAEESSGDAENSSAFAAQAARRGLRFPDLRSARIAWHSRAGRVIFLCKIHAHITKTPKPRGLLVR